MMLHAFERGGFRVPAGMRGCVLLGFVLVFGLGSAWAQQVSTQPAPAASSPQQLVDQQGLIAPGALLGVGLQVVQAIDAARYQELWVGASPAVRALVSDADFIKGVARMRSREPGTPTRRVWVRLDVQQQSAQTDRNGPRGLYATCAFESQFGNAIKREVVSFRFDEDRQWRLAGYYLQ